jgi:hypothetical protein
MSCGNKTYILFSYKSIIIPKNSSNLQLSAISIGTVNNPYRVLSKLKSFQIGATVYFISRFNLISKD